MLNARTLFPPLFRPVDSGGGGGNVKEKIAEIDSEITRISDDITQIDSVITRLTILTDNETVVATSADGNQIYRKIFVSSDDFEGWNTTGIKTIPSGLNNVTIIKIDSLYSSGDTENPENLGAFFTSKSNDTEVDTFYGQLSNNIGVHITTLESNRIINKYRITLYYIKESEV